MKYLVRRWRRLILKQLPDRELILRTDGKVWFLRLSRKIQLACGLFVLIFSGWGVFSSVSYFVSEKIIETKELEILKNRLVYRSLLSEISDYQSKFTILTNDLEKNHGLMLGLVEKNAVLQQNLLSAESKLVSSKRQFESKLVSSKRQFESKLVSSKRREDEIASVKDDLKAKLQNIEQRLHSLNTHNFQLKGNLSTVSGSLESALAERNKSLALNERLKRKISNLNQRLNSIVESEKDVVARLTHKTSEEIDFLELFIGRTGVKPRELVASTTSVPLKGQGGPFIEIKQVVGAGGLLKASLDNLDARMERLTTLKNLVGIMPLSAPMDHFSVTSHFGKRRDPINKRWAMHYGLDLGGFKKSRVYSTAPGRVIKSGHMRKYGKFVEIDHGSGFKTRYGHLNRILVQRGQKVEFRHKIGLLGNTGRSTGPHLHYEILYNGKPMNPWRFIKAGRYVYKK